MYIIYKKTFSYDCLPSKMVKKPICLCRIGFRRLFTLVDFWPLGLFTAWLFIGWLFFLVVFVGWPISGRLFVGDVRLRVVFFWVVYVWMAYFRVAFFLVAYAGSLISRPYKLAHMKWGTGPQADNSVTFTLLYLSSVWKITSNFGAILMQANATQGRVYCIQRYLMVVRGTYMLNMVHIWNQLFCFQIYYFLTFSERKCNFKKFLLVSFFGEKK